MDEIERMLRDAMPINRREVAEIIDKRMDRIEARVKALESRSPTDSAVPEPAGPPTESISTTVAPPTADTDHDSEPKVVGWVAQPALMTTGWGFIEGKSNETHDAPAILQSEHEAVVRGLREYCDEAWHGAELADKAASGYKRRLRERNDEIARLKAENERLRARNERLTRRLDRFADHLQVRDRQVATLRAERDAYADPKNWRGYHKSGIPTSTGVQFRYVGPTPADSTEPESVEGEVCKGRHGGAWYIGLGGRESPWPEGTPVRITKIPGGDDDD